MKITLTIEEIKSLVAEKYSVEEFDLEIVDEVESQPTEGDAGWISNIGRDSPILPSSLGPKTRIQVKFRTGEVDTGYGCDWYESWRETDHQEYDIVAYRVIK